jgi:hypothetical protein
MLLEMVYLHPGRLPAGLLADVGAPVEDLDGQHPVGTLDFAVVPGVPSHERDDGTDNVPGFTVGAVVSDHDVQLVNAVGSEECLSSTQEPDRCFSPLVLNDLGIGRRGDPFMAECR